MKNSLIISSGLSVLITMLFKYLNEMSKTKKQNLSSFECGFDTKYFKKNLFSTKYMMILIMFLIFDVEVSFMLPIIVMKSNTMKMKTVLILFLMILTTILMKEWKQGLVEWNI